MPDRGDDLGGGPDREVVRSWDREYALGRYEDEPPVPFVEDILRAVAADGLSGARGLDIGCGNGRNYIPMVLAGLDLIGLDVSAAALDRLAARMRERRDRLVLGDLAALPEAGTYPVVIGIQVFQHGDRRATHRFLADAQDRVAPGGLFCLRVNAVGTHVWPEHEIVERHPDGGFTVRYTTGSKNGILIHFFSSEEIVASFRRAFEVVLPLRLTSTERVPPAPGTWAQWEGIWRRTAGESPVRSEEAI
jgi:SAM-dependent methyltransferase